MVIWLCRVTKEETLSGMEMVERTSDLNGVPSHAVVQKKADYLNRNRSWQISYHLTAS